MCETVWSFETKHFRITLEIEPCQDDPADHFQFEDDVEAVRNGDVAWFDATVAVYFEGNRVGSDHLGCCAYNSAEDFYTSHRDADPRNRNCTLMRAAKGQNVSICHYFPSMVSEAIADARRNVQKWRAIPMRAA